MVNCFKTIRSQNNKAVEKTNAHQNLALIKAMAEFAEEYKLVHGQYPYRFSQLNTTLPDHNDVSTNECSLAVATNDTGSYGYTITPDTAVKVGKYQIVLNTTMPGNMLGVASVRKSDQYGCYGFFYRLQDRRFTCAEHASISGSKSFCADVMGLTLTNSGSWKWYNM